MIAIQKYNWKPGIYSNFLFIMHYLLIKVGNIWYQYFYVKIDLLDTSIKNAELTHYILPALLIPQLFYNVLSHN